jgi:hypothetical protein
MTIGSEAAVTSMISDEIESESVTDAIASAREVVISVEDESAKTKQPDEGEAPCDEPDDVPPSTEPEPGEPDSDDQE